MRLLGIRSKEQVQRLQNFREDETGGRDSERYDDEQVDRAFGR